MPADILLVVKKAIQVDPPGIVPFIPLVISGEDARSISGGPQGTGTTGESPVSFQVRAQDMLRASFTLPVAAFRLWVPTGAWGSLL